MPLPPRLGMIALGIEGDAPPVSIQPKLEDGIHLRWASRRDLSFPWYGYFLFRRLSQRKEWLCLSGELYRREPGELGTTSWSFDLGTVSSDRPLRLADDFPPSGRVEIDLGGDRRFLRFALPQGHLASRAEARIGFGEQTVLQRDCVDLTRVVEVPRKNPFRFRSLLIDVAESVLRPRLPPMLPLLAGRVTGGVDAGSMATIHLDQPGAEVVITLAHSGTGARVTGFDDAGKPVAEAAMPGVERYERRSLTLRAARPIARVEVQTRFGHTVLLEVCRIRRSEAGAGLRVVASYLGVPMASAELSGKPGEILDVTLAADPIDEIAFLPLDGKALPQAALVDLCLDAGTRDLRRGWEPVPDCRYPIALPVFHPDYPASGNAAVDRDTAEAVALDRIRYGDPAEHSGAAFDALHEALLTLVKGGPGGPAMADPGRASAIPADTAPGDPEAPSLSAMHPLDMTLLASVHPAGAQMLGLYWVDRTADRGMAYDYLVIADDSGAAGGEPMAALGQWLGGTAGYDGFIIWNRQVAPAPPLPPPTGQRAYSLPLGAVVASTGGEALPLAGLVGLRWALPMSGGVLLPESAVAYHLWREWLGNGEAPAAPAGAGDWLTKAGPVLVATPITNPFAEPQRPPDWPPFALHRIDRVETEGWYAYGVSGMDLFGRISPPSDPCPWHQWAPPPSPVPWYYTLPPSDAAVHPEAVRVLDKMPPPAPVGVEAVALDPQDPFVLADAPYLAWRASLPPALRETLVGLRVTWRWSASQARQAPDTAEFRLYFNPGGTLPGAEARAAANWAMRVHVVPHADAAAVAGNGDRLYRVFLPVPGGADFATGVPLVPTLANPVAYAHVGVSAADAAPHTPDEAKWASGNWGGRPGNEGLLGVPAKVFRVRRVPPEPPVPPPDSDKVFATPADYHAQSFYTYRWVPAAYLRTHVLRAMDASVFAADRALRPRPAISAATPGIFPDPAQEPRWDALKRQQVADELNALNAHPRTEAGERAARAACRALSNDALRVLAGLPGTEAAFTQVTVTPLDPDDPATANRAGPDNPATFPVDPGLRIYIDTLDGRGTNRYFYRSVYVDGAHNRSAPSLSGPPIWLPNVVPPRAPALTAVTGGERAITLAWASNREDDLAAYRVYRAESAEAARDLRAMALVATVPVPAGDPSSRPAGVGWTDAPVPGLRNRWYAVTAVDTAGNESAPSRTALGRAFDESPPVPPPLTAGWTAAAPPAQARLVWSAPEDETRVERREVNSLQWEPLGGWRAPGAHDETLALDATLSWRLRIRSRKDTGAQAVGTPVPLNRL